jgi:predicted Zn-dependent protease
MQDRLQEAIRLRTTGRADEARTLLLELITTYPDNAGLQYQMAWTHDNLGREREAVPYYRRAIALGLAGEELAGALLGLGSTYRALGEYQLAVETLRRGAKEFPEKRSFQVFLAMALYNTGQHQKAIELLLTNLAETTADADIHQYKRAILFYAPQLAQTWD